MDRLAHFDFQWYSYRDLIRGRDALTILVNHGFIDYEPELLTNINAELSRRIDCQVDGLLIGE